MSKHTPGPWSITPHSTIDKEFKVGPAIIDYDDVDHEVAEADAKLIAAAPDLLSALIDMVSKAGKQNWNDNYPEEMGAAQAAIAKATT